ncbi:MAG: hypothetical protein DI565_15950 [Ancylobacter novellus]|uniref:Uncharacterized protein n=1 Tax=Ancylobacter novellus TaxID=921 RepID=A0A2W5K9R6_ANCNO|nr:MAG: hypothetical protein DI565_15950 [Ancylobacter novellus]
MPWARLAGAVSAAEDALARLDERLAKSPVRDGFLARTHFNDACASLWLDGELVHLEDLVLHDAMMDIRTPTAELVRAHSALRARRRIAKADAGWALTAGGLDALRGRPAPATPPAPSIDSDEDWDASDTDAEWRKALAAVDAVVARSEKLLAGEAVVEKRPREDRPALVYDLDWDEDARLAGWRAVVAATRSLPPTLGAAIALDAWTVIEPLQSNAWLGRLLVGDLLRSRGKTRAHLASISTGLKATPQEKRWKRDPVIRLEVALEALAASAEAGLKDHDRLVTARDRLTRRAGDRRSSSSLPALIDLAVETPVVSAALISQRLKVTQRAATGLAQELGLRETTGRKRYRAWSAA